jgi:uncharacterized damage-inducible protein DinB
MNGTDFTRLFAYAAASRRRFLSRFRELGWDEVTRNREATHRSLHNILVHMLDVEESYLQEAIQGKPVPELDPRDFETFEDLQAHDCQVTARTETLLRSLTPSDLPGAISVPWWKSRKKQTIERVLLHAFLDEIAHLGEMVGLMWQMDEEPPWTSIIRTWETDPPTPPVDPEKGTE